MFIVLIACLRADPSLFHHDQQKSFYELTDIGQDFQGTVLQSPVHVKEYWRYFGAIPWSFKPTCVRAIHDSAFSQAFPSSVLLQHQCFCNESTQKMIWLQYILYWFCLFVFIKFVFAVTPNYVALNWHGTTASFFRKHSKSSWKEALEISVLKLPQYIFYIYIYWMGITILRMIFSVLVELHQLLSLSRC